MVITYHEWDAFLEQHPDVHLLQTTEWGQLKADFGWEPVYLLKNNIGALILFRALPLGYTIAYMPKGPIGDASIANDFWEEVESLCRKKNAIFLKLEPDGWETPKKPLINALSVKRIYLSSQSIQPPRTIVLDLNGTEEQIQARMKQKTRYNIRLAQKKGVIVHSSSDIDTFSSLMNITGARDSFGVHTLEYYQRAYELFHPLGKCELFIAEFDHQPLGGIMVFKQGTRAWYFYGASDNAHRNLMPTYLLQWKAIQWASEQGCTEYDLWGIPDADEETLENEFLERSDGLWGVYRFKRGFGGEIKRAEGPWDVVFSPLLYQVYLLWTKQRAASS